MGGKYRAASATAANGGDKYRYYFGAEPLGEATRE
jgi:hypothetical protein